MGRKEGAAACAPFGGGKLGPHLTQCGLGEAYLRTKWHLDPSSRLVTTDNGRKLAAVPFGGGGAGSPSNTVWPGSRPTSVPSFILIPPTVWSQYTNVTDRETGQPSDSTGRTVLQTVAQKLRWRVPLFGLEEFQRLQTPRSRGCGGRCCKKSPRSLCVTAMAAVSLATRRRLQRTAHEPRPRRTVVVGRL